MMVLQFTGSLPVPLLEWNIFRVTLDASGRLRDLEMLHKEQNRLSNLVGIYTLSGCSIAWRDDVTIFAFFAVLYRCCTPEAKDISCFDNCTTVQRSYMRNFISVDDIQYLKTGLWGQILNEGRCIFEGKKSWHLVKAYIIFNFPERRSAPKHEKTLKKWRSKGFITLFMNPYIIVKCGSQCDRKMYHDIYGFELLDVVDGRLLHGFTKGAQSIEIAL